MKEVAFRVKPDSELYKNHFKEKEERKKLHEYARTFFKKHGFCDNGGSYQRQRLSMELTPEEHEKYASQLKKHPDSNGLYTFKANSAMQNGWWLIMKLKCKSFGSLCELEVFEINGIKADYDDFGTKEDINSYNAEPYCCGNMKFIPHSRPKKRSSWKI